MPFIEIDDYIAAIEAKSPDFRLRLERARSLVKGDIERLKQDRKISPDDLNREFDI